MRNRNMLVVTLVLATTQVMACGGDDGGPLVMAPDASTSPPPTGFGWINLVADADGVVQIDGVGIERVADTANRTLTRPNEPVPMRIEVAFGDHDITVVSNAYVAVTRTYPVAVGLDIVVDVTMGPAIEGWTYQCDSSPSSRNAHMFVSNERNMVMIQGLGPYFRMHGNEGSDELGNAHIIFSDDHRSLDMRGIDALGIERFVACTKWEPPSP